MYRDLKPRRSLLKRVNYKTINKKDFRISKKVSKKYLCVFCKIQLKSSTENTLRLHFQGALHKKSFKDYFSQFEIDLDEDLLEYVSEEEVELIDIIAL